MLEAALRKALTEQAPSPARAVIVSEAELEKMQALTTRAGLDVLVEVDPALDAGDIRLDTVRGRFAIGLHEQIAALRDFVEDMWDD